MSRLPAILAVLAMLAAVGAPTDAAQAQGGVNLSWGDCGNYGQFQRNFACNVNSGVNVLVASAIAPAAMPRLNGQTSVIEMITNQPTLSSWWQLNLGGCRYNSPQVLSAGFNFLTDSNCLDPWGGGASGGINYAPGSNGPNRARIRTVCAIPATTSITGTDEYYFFKVVFTNARSIGTGSCAGCTDGACFVFRSLVLTQPAGVGDYTMVEQPLSRLYVQWQAGAANVAGGCPAATPGTNATWGAVKSLYR